MDKTTEKILKAVAPIVSSAASLAVIGVAGYFIKKLVVTNFEEKDVTGERKCTPTKDVVTISEVKANANKTNAALAEDKVNGQGGDLSGLVTDARVGDTEATVLEGGATAVRTMAGGADIEVKAFKST